MTERLYYTDSFLSEFDATVVAVEVGGRMAVVLNRTAFYPTSGGQVFDTGALVVPGGTDVPVTEVAENEAGDVLHYVSEGRFEPGMKVQGRVDAARRRDHMQQHSGQHVLSATFVELFHAPTISFHMGDESCTIDLATKDVSEEQFSRAEELANRIVFENR